MFDLKGCPELAGYVRWVEMAPTMELRRYAEAALRRARANLVLQRLNDRNLAKPPCHPVRPLGREQGDGLLRWPRQAVR